MKTTLLSLFLLFLNIISIAFSAVPHSLFQLCTTLVALVFGKLLSDLRCLECWVLSWWAEKLSNCFWAFALLWRWDRNAHKHTVVFWDFTTTFTTHPQFLKERQGGGFVALFMMKWVKKGLCQRRTELGINGNVCGPVADSYIRLAFVYSAHLSCSPSVFLQIPSLNILLWKNPSRRYRPLPRNMLKIPTKTTFPAPFLVWFSVSPDSCRFDRWPSHLFLSSTQHQFIISHYPKLSCVFSLRFELPPSGLDLSDRGAPCCPQRLLALSADINNYSSVPPMHPSRQQSKLPAKPVRWPSGQPDVKTGSVWGRNLVNRWVPRKQKQKIGGSSSCRDTEMFTFRWKGWRYSCL